MPDRRGTRFVLEALFLVALAVGADAGEARPARDRRGHAARLGARCDSRMGGLARRAAFRKRAAAALLRAERQPAACSAARTGSRRVSRGDSGTRHRRGSPRRRCGPRCSASGRTRSRCRSSCRPSPRSTAARRAPTSGRRSICRPCPSTTWSPSPRRRQRLPLAGRPHRRPTPPAPSVLPRARPGTASIRSGTRRLAGASAAVRRRHRKRSMSQRGLQGPGRFRAGRIARSSA